MKDKFIIEVEETNDIDKQGRCPVCGFTTTLKDDKWTPSIADVEEDPRKWFSILLNVWRDHDKHKPEDGQIIIGSKFDKVKVGFYKDGQLVNDDGNCMFDKWIPFPREIPNGFSEDMEGEKK